MIKYLKSKIGIILLVFGIVIVFNINLYLYRINSEIIIYSDILTVIFMIIFMLCDYIGYKKRLDNVKNINLEIVSDISGYRDEIEKEYQQLIVSMQKEMINLKEANAEYIDNLNEYYTMWVHQIKTPISAMKLILDEESNIDISIELLKIEQYVQMVLSYIRLNNEVSDYVFRKVNLDKIIREILRTYSIMFIKKGIRVEYQETNYEFISDDKWMGFAIEQVISNALKYTKPNGNIKIYLQDNILIIEDNGIGIKEEDIPRIFEKGYSGYQGREETRATGIGLYLTKTILSRLNHDIWIKSECNKGTKVYINLYKEKKYYD